MKTASKVINDRIEILNEFLDKIKDSTNQDTVDNKEKIIQVRETFEALQAAITGCIGLRESGADTEAHIDMIKEFTGQTIVPLTERVKQQLESFSQMIYSLQQKVVSIPGDFPEEAKIKLKTEQNAIAEAIKGYEAVKSDTTTYLEEYETALDEIKEFIIAEDINEITEEIDNEDQKRLDSLAADINKMKERGITFVEDKTEDNDFYKFNEDDKPEENKNQLKEDTNGEFPI